MSNLMYHPKYIEYLDNSLLLSHNLYNLRIHNKNYINYSTNNILDLLFPYYSLSNKGSIKLLNNSNISEIFNNFPNNILLSSYEIIYIFNLIYKNNMNILEINNNKYTFLNSVKYISKKKNFKNRYDINIFEAYINEHKLKEKNMKISIS